MSVFYGAYNARHYSPKDVAATFISSNEYDRLCELSNSVVLGARGSGKTTIMKMLTPEGRFYWRGKGCSGIAELPFIGIYVPTDIQWHHQLNYSKNILHRYKNFSELSSKASVTTSICLSVIDCLNALLNYGILGPSEKVEEELCSTLIRSCLLPPTIPCFADVRVKLHSRVNEIRLHINKQIYTNKAASAGQDLPDYFFLDYLSVIAPILFRSTEFLTIKKKWALCFDELEMAPEWLQSSLFSELRCTPPHIIFKLSTAPIPLVETRTNPTPSNDYTIIRMWSDITSERKRFCDSIAKTIIRKTLGQACSPKDIFGASAVSSNSQELGSLSYEKRSEVAELIKIVASNDEGLRKILLSHGIDSEDPYTTDITKRDQVLRKLKPLVYQKVAFLKWKDGKISERSRKTATEIYSGVDAIYRVSDGNPRRLIGIINELLKHVEYDRNSKPKEISREAQATVIYNASKKFCSFVKGIPESSIEFDKRQITLYRQLKRIGKYFFNGMVKGNATLDPCGSFVIDSLIDEGHIKILKIALDQGAIILIDPFSESIESSLREKRYRLSFMFSPIFKLPLRLYPAINLSTCLGIKKPSTTHKAPLLSQGEFQY